MSDLDLALFDPDSLHTPPPVPSRRDGCGHPISRPRSMWTWTEKYKGAAPDVRCNRPAGHPGPHRYLDEAAQIKAEASG